MHLLSLGTSNPPNRFTQAECWNAVRISRAWAALRPRSKIILRTVLNNPNGIRQRYLALDNLSEAFETDPDTMCKRFALWAPKLATQAAQNAMDESGLVPDHIDGLIVSSHTGYLCP